MASKCKCVVLSITGLFILLLAIIYSTGRGLSNRTSDMPNCLFCDIANGKVPATKLEYETDEFVIFKDIKPASKYHYLAVPRQHYDSLKVLNKSHEALVTRMEEGLKKFFVSKGISTKDALFGFHLPPFISVKHLHMHGISPHSEMGFFAKLVFKPSTFWFSTVDEARDYLRHKLH